MNDPIVKRNLDLVTVVTQFILAHPRMLEQLPQDFRLVVLPEDDRELSQFNLDLLSKRDAQGKPIVIARMSAQADWSKEPPNVYVPVVA